MRRIFAIAVVTALFLGVGAGIAGALDSAAWSGKASGSVIADNPGYEGLTVDLAVTTHPRELNWTNARGQGHYEFDGNGFRLRVTHACVDTTEGTVTAWGPARITAGSFDVVEGPSLVVGDTAYAVLSLLDNEGGIVSARAGIATDFDGGLMTMIAQNCEWPFEGWFPARGPGELSFKAR